MKRNQEVLIIVEALAEDKLIGEDSIDRAKHIVKEALKEVRRRRYLEKTTKN